MNEDRTTEEERRYIMEARKRAMLKRKKLRTLGKSRDELNWEPVVGGNFFANWQFKIFGGKLQRQPAH